MPNEKVDLGREIRKRERLSAPIGRVRGGGDGGEGGGGDEEGRREVNMDLPMDKWKGSEVDWYRYIVDWTISGGGGGGEEEREEKEEGGLRRGKKEKEGGRGREGEETGRREEDMN